MYTYNEVKSINLNNAYKVVSGCMALSECIVSFPGGLVYMYFSVSAPSAQHSLHLFGFSVFAGIDVDSNNSQVLLIFKTSCWLI